MMLRIDSTSVKRPNSSVNDVFRDSSTVARSQAISNQHDSKNHKARKSFKVSTLKNIKIKF